MLSTIMRKLDELTQTVTKREKDWESLAPIIKNNAELLQDHSRLLTQQNKQVDKITGRLEQMENTSTCVTHLVADMDKLKTEMKQLKQNQQASTDLPFTPPHLNNAGHVPSSFATNLTPPSPPISRKHRRTNGRGRLRTLRDDARSIKLSNKTMAVDVPRMNFRHFGDHLVEALMTVYPSFQADSIEAIRRDFKSNLYVQFKAQFWDHFCSLTHYNSPLFQPITLELPAWGNWTIELNPPSLTINKIQVVVSNIPLDLTADQIAEEILKSNSSTWKTLTGDNMPIHGVRRLHRKQRGSEGSFVWVASTSVAFWLSDSLWPLHEEHMSVSFAYQQKPLAIFTPARRFCSRCLELGTHSEQQCLNKPKCSECGHEHLTDSCPANRTQQLKHSLDVRALEDTVDQLPRSPKKQMVRQELMLDENMVESRHISAQGHLGSTQHT